MGPCDCHELKNDISWFMYGGNHKLVYKKKDEREAIKGGSLCGIVLVAACGDGWYV